MRKWYPEPCRFRITILEVGSETEPPRACRAGHEPGDTYEFDYCTPAEVCGDLFHHLFPTLHTFRTEADMRWNFGWEEGDRKVLWCPGRVVRLELRRLSGHELSAARQAREAESLLG
jgi:uncharacterized repeat protein (TIGR04076 family)